MRRSPMATLAGIAAIAALSVAAWAETVTLRTGESLTGEVKLLEGGAIVVAQRFPDERQVTLSRDDLTPESLFEILDRRTDARDAAARRKLGDLAMDLGLYGRAVAEFRAVKELEPAMAKELDTRIAMLLEAIATDVLDDAKGLLDAGRARAALMYLHTLRERYAATAAAREGEGLMARAHKEAAASADVAQQTVTADEAPKVLARAEANLARGRDAAKALGGHGGSSVRDQRAAESAIVHLERAWEGVRTLPVTSDDAATERRIAELRKTTKSELVQAHLQAGTILLGRRSIRSAEEHCNRACELDPDNAENHALHRMVLAAKALGRGGGR